ncbi:NADH dehydrogenase subunit 4, partial [Operophtera brumata]
LNINNFTNISYIFSCDLISFGLIILRIWICILIIIASENLLKLNFYTNFFLFNINSNFNINYWVGGINLSEFKQFYNINYYLLYLSMILASLVKMPIAGYRLYLYSYIQHGKYYYGVYSFYVGVSREYLLLILHWLPLNILILKIS